MNPFDDDGSEMNMRRGNRGLSEVDADALLSGRSVPEHGDLGEVIALLRTASAVPAPAPTASLATVLRDGFDPLPLGVAASGGRWTLRFAAASAAVVTALLGAATANALPPAVQNVVADVVGTVSPLQLPRPAAPSEAGVVGTSGDEAGPDDAPSDDVVDGSPGDEPAPVAPATASPSPTAPVLVRPLRPSPRPTPSDAADVDEPDSDEPDSDEPDSDPDSDERESDEPDSDEPDTDEPDSDEREGEADGADADQPEGQEAPGAAERDDADSDEPELETPDKPEQDEVDTDE